MYTFADDYKNYTANLGGPTYTGQKTDVSSTPAPNFADDYLNYLKSTPAVDNSMATVANTASIMQQRKLEEERKRKEEEDKAKAKEEETKRLQEQTNQGQVSSNPSAVYVAPQVKKEVKPTVYTNKAYSEMRSVKGVPTKFDAQPTTQPNEPEMQSKPGQETQFDKKKKLAYILPSETETSQEFGAKNNIEVFSGGVNYGTDFPAKKGTPVSVPSGKWKVVGAYAGETQPGYIGNNANSGYGNSVLVQNVDTGERMRFSHLSEVNVQPGEDISSGTQVGKVGATGNTTGDHLDLEYYDSNGRISDVKRSKFARFLYPSLYAGTNKSGGGGVGSPEPTFFERQMPEWATQLPNKEQKKATVGQYLFGTEGSYPTVPEVLQKAGDAAVAVSRAVPMTSMQNIPIEKPVLKATNIATEGMNPSIQELYQTKQLLQDRLFSAASNMKPYYKKALELTQKYLLEQIK
jgi:murein DD-endopeptidase MepM/ murein hydrolase activator NlpD